MRILIQINSIDYGDVAVKALPMLQNKAGDSDSAMSKIMAAVANLPPDLVHQLLDAIPQEDKNEIISKLICENHERIITAVNSLTQKNFYSAVDGIVLNKELLLGLSISKIDYSALAEKYLPVIADSISGQRHPIVSVIAGLLKLPPKMYSFLINKLKQETKDEAVAFLINTNQQKLITLAENAAQKQGIHLKIAGITVEA